VSELREAPLLLCYDGSQNAKDAIRKAGELLTSRNALVVNVWASAAGPGGLAWADAITPMLNYAELDRAAGEASAQIAQEGLDVARHAGLRALPVLAHATGPVWKTIIEIADAHDVAVIVMGSRGLSGTESILHGSVSSPVLHHAGRPTLVVPGGHRGAKASERTSWCANPFQRRDRRKCGANAMPHR